VTVLSRRVDPAGRRLRAGDGVELEQRAPQHVVIAVQLARLVTGGRRLRGGAVDHVDRLEELIETVQLTKDRLEVGVSVLSRTYSAPSTSASHGETSQSLVVASRKVRQKYTWTRLALF